MLETLSEQRCHGGVQGVYRHASTACGGTMQFALFMPAQAKVRSCALLYFLAGLTCSWETATIKAGAQRLAAQFGLALVMPDTSPRATAVAGATDDWEVGEGAGFYLDATQAPWATNFRMETYLTEELPQVLAANFALDVERSGLCGHSMGGHGALTLALRHPQQYQSVSALAPIVAPAQVPWGRKAFTTFLGPDESAWAAHDASALIATRRFPGTILIDQGEADPYLSVQLRPELFAQACAEVDQPLLLRRHAGYDHSYYFVASFIDDHLRHHATALNLL